MSEYRRNKRPTYDQLGCLNGTAMCNPTGLGFKCYCSLNFQASFVTEHKSFHCDDLSDNSQEKYVVKLFQQITQTKYKETSITGNFISREQRFLKGFLKNVVSDYVVTWQQIV